MPPKQTDPQYKLRMTPDLKAKLDTAAAQNGRSLNAEILRRLEASFPSSVTDDAPAHFDPEANAYMVQILNLFSEIIRQGRGRDDAMKKALEGALEAMRTGRN